MASNFHLILDFDGTLTISDTTALLGQAGLDWQQRHARTVPPWSHFSDAYMKDLEAHDRSFQAGPPPNDLPRAHALTAALRDAILYLRSLADVEEASAQRVIESAFAELPRDEVERAAANAVRDERVTIRPGTVSLFANAHQHRFGVELLSVNWSEAWIRACLLAAAERERDADAVKAIEGAYIAANETPSISGRRTPLHNSAYVSGTGIRTSRDKLDHVRGRQREIADANDNAALLVYVGDSATDVEALLAADVGVCIRDEPMRSGHRELKDLLENKGGLAVEDMTHAATLGPSAQDAPRLFFARDFHLLVSRLSVQTSSASTKAD